MWWPNCFLLFQDPIFQQVHRFRGINEFPLRHSQDARSESLLWCQHRIMINLGRWNPKPQLCEFQWAKEHQQLPMLHQWCPPYCWNRWISNLALAGLRLCHMCPSWPLETCWSNKWVAVIHRHRSCHCGPHQSDQSQPSQEKDGY